MGHVDEKEGADRIRRLPQPGEVDGAGIGRAAGDDEPGSMLAGEGIDGVVVDQPVLPANAILHDRKAAAREIVGRAMAQMAAGEELHRQDLVALLQEGHEDRRVRLTSRMGLYIGEAAAKEVPGALDGDALDDVDIGGTAVVAASRITLDRLVRE